MPAHGLIVVLNASAVARHERIECELRERFRALGCDANVIVAAGQDLTDVARQAATRASTVVAAGGDGTVSSVVAGIIGDRTTLGVVPLGTLNHFAKDLRIPLDAQKAVETILGGHVQRVDVG